MGVSVLDANLLDGHTHCMNDVGRKRLQALIDERVEGDMKKASLEAGLGATYARDILKRGHNGRTRELSKLARYFSVSLDYLIGDETGQSSDRSETKGRAPSAKIYITGRVGAGVWLEVGSAHRADHFKVSMFPPDLRYPLTAQFDLEVAGTSLDRVAADGELLRCVRFGEANLSAQNGDLVVVERIRDDGGLIETTAKYFFEKDSVIELRPASTDPRWQEPLLIRRDLNGSETVRVTALVLYKYKPLSR